MQYNRDTKNGTVTLDGTPEEISNYHKLMAYNMKGSRKTKRQISGTKKASYSSNERRVMIKLANEGKTTIKIARHLWRNNISPIKRTGRAIYSELYRMQKDPERR